jgi:hypothetical protein
VSAPDFLAIVLAAAVDSEVAGKIASKDLQRSLLYKSEAGSFLPVLPAL